MKLEHLFEIYLRHSQTAKCILSGIPYPASSLSQLGRRLKVNCRRKDLGPDTQPIVCGRIGFHWSNHWTYMVTTCDPRVTAF